MGFFAKLGIVACVSAVSLAGPAAAKTEEAPPQSKWERDLQRLGEAVERRECDRIAKLAPPIADAPPGSGVPDQARPMALIVLALCEHEKGAKDQAYAHVLRATEFVNSPELAWELRLSFEVEHAKLDSAVATVEAMSQGRGAALNAMRMSTLWSLDTELKESGQKPLRKRLLAVLSSDGYDPDETFVPADDFRLSFAQMLSDSGDRERARALALGLRDPYAIGQASLDLRLRGFFPADVDVRAAAERELAVHREAMALHPDRIRPIWEASQNLRQLGRAQEALELLRAAEPKLDDEGAFTDLEENLSWFWDNMARTYRMLGRHDEAFAAYAKGGAASEGGNLNVSQVLNMAANQLRLGRNEDALRTVALFDDPKRGRSDYGEMVLRFVRGCAHAFAGRSDRAAEDLAYAKAHQKVNRGAYSHLLLCTGDMDGAAAAYIERLDDPEQRGDVLMAFSDYDDPPVAGPTDPFDVLLDAIEARPDVKAAIERAGGIGRFNVQGFHV